MKKRMDFFLARLINWIAPPVFPADETRTRKAAFLNVFLAIFLCGLPFINISYLINKNTAPVIQTLNIFFWIVCLGLKAALNRGYVRLSSTILMVCGLVILASALISQGTIWTAATYTLILFIIMASILFDRSGYLLIAGICSLIVLGIILASNRGLLPVSDHSAGLTQWILFTVLFVVSGEMTYWGFKTARQALARADREIAVRLQAEQALYQNKQLLEEAQNIAHLGSWTTDLVQRTFDVSPQGARLVGWEPGLHRIEEWMEATHPIDQDAVLAAWNAGLKGGTYDFEHRILVKGETRWVHVTANFSYDGEGKPVSAFGVMQDITGWKHAEQEQRETESLYRYLFDNSKDAIILTDVATRTIFDCNQSAAEMNGYSSSAELIGQSIDILHAEEFTKQAQDPAFMNQQLETIRQKGVARVEVPHQTRDGRVFFIESSICMLTIHGQEVMFGIDRDITERKHHEELIEAQRDLARLLSQELADQETWDACFKIALSVSQMDSGGMYLFNEDTHLLELTYHQGLRPGFVNTVATFPEDSRSAQLALSGNNFYLSESNVGGTPHYITEGLRCVAVIPIKFQGKVLGCLNIASHTFTSVPDVSRTALETIAGEIGNIIIYRRALQSLKSSQQQLSQALTSARMGTWRWYIPTNQLVWSPESAQIFGVETLQNSFKAILERVHPEDQSRLESSLQEAFKQKELLNREFRIFNPQGKPIWVTNYGTVENGPDGKPLAISGLIQDITERKEAELAIQKSKQILEEAQAIANLGSFTVDMVNRVMDVTPEWARVVGWTEGQYSIDEWIPTTYPEDREAVQAAWQASRNGAPCDIVHRILKDGEVRWTHTTARLEFDPQGKPIRALGVTQDITEQKRVEQARLESESLYHQLFENSQDAIILTNMDTMTIFDCNQSACEMNGYTRAELVGQPINILHDEETAKVLSDPAFFGQQMEMLHQVGVLRGEGKHRTRDGREIVVESCLSLATLNGRDLVLGIDRDITERKQVEMALRESEELFRRMFEDHQGVMLLVDPMSGRILDANHSAQAFYGYTGEELTSLNIAELNTVTPEQIQQKIQQAAHGEVNHFEAVHLLSNGETRTVDVYSSPVMIGDRQVLFSVIHDITSRKRTEAALVESERRFSSVFQKSFDAILILKAENGACINANDTFYQMFELEPEQVIGRGFLDLNFWIHPDQLNEITKILQSSGAKSNYEIEFWTASNRLIYGLTSVIQTTISGEECILVFIKDITLRKHAEEALRASEEKYRSLMESLDNAVSTVDEDGKFLYLNDVAARELGGTPRDFVGQTITDLFPESVAERQLKHIQRAIHKDQRLVFENKSVIQGEPRWFRTTIEPIHDEKGQAIHALVNSTDIHELKMAQEELLNLNRSLEERVQLRTAELESSNIALEKAMHTRDQFMAAMSHELRTPLTGILGLSETMQLGIYGSLNEKQQKAAQNIEKSGRRLLQLINDLIDYTRFQSGQLTLQIMPCYLNSVCQISIQGIKTKAAEKHQVIQLHLPDEKITLNADERRLRQALVSLLDNAIKFSPEAGQIDVTVTPLPEQKQVQIAVADTGIGIKTEDLPRLFQPFVQLDSRLARMYEGTGLGLALTKALVEQHGGSVQVESEFGHGACFTILLPWS